jgi:xylan 1,4-beta-xylosidase
MHDTNLNAAYVALQLSRLGDDHASYSYWTFGDIFEENGVPFTPFHGGFGLVANGCIPKPTFWTFAFFKKLQGTCVYRSDHAVIVRTADGGFRAVLWNLCMQEKKELELTIILPVCEEGVYSLAGRSVQEDDCNPLKVWHDLGEPSSLSPGQKKLLRESAVPRVFSARLEAAGGQLVLVQKLTANAVAELEIKRITTLPDRGYSYERVMSPNFI